MWQVACAPPDGPDTIIRMLARTRIFTLQLHSPAPQLFDLGFRGAMYDRRTGSTPEDAPPAQRVEAKVKWFNPSKGFGFVVMADGSPDAFLPMAILRRAGYEDVREGASITCEIGAGAKGPLVTTVISIDVSTAVAPGA